MKPMVLSPPEIAAPIYVHGQAIAVGGHAANARIRIFRYPGGTGAPQKISTVTAPMVPVFNIRVDQIQYNDQIFAIQELNGSTGQSAVLTAQIPAKPLLAPYVRTPLYACARCIAVGNIMNGAEIEVFIKGESVFRAPIGFHCASVNVEPLQAGDEVYVTQSFPDIPPAQSPVERVVPYPQEQLPPPVLRVPLIECAPSYEVEGLVPGAMVSVYEARQEEPIGHRIADAPRISVESPHGGLGQDWVLTADQQLCGPDRSPRSAEVEVEDIGCFGTYPPVICKPIRPGDKFIAVEGVHESTIRILADGKDIGGGTCFGLTVFNLDPPLPNASIQAIGSFDCRMDVWEAPSLPVKSVPDDEVIDVEKEDFYSVVLHSPLPVLVDLWAEWCHWCISIITGGYLEQLAKDYAGRAVIARVNYDKFKPVSTTDLPCFVFFKNGQIVKQIVGWDELAIRSTLDSLV